MSSTATVDDLVMAADPERVRLVVDRVGAVDALVARSVPGAAELVLTGPLPTPVRFLHRRTGRALSLGPEPSEAIAGTVLAIADPSGRVREDVVHFLFAHVLEDALAADAARPQASNRREWVRIAVRRPVTLLPERGWVDGQTLDLSAGGTLVTGADPLVVGDHVRIRLELMPDEIVDARGRVARAGPDGLRGVAIERIADADRERIAHWAAEQQRIALRALRA